MVPSLPFAFVLDPDRLRVVSVSRMRRICFDTETPTDYTPDGVPDLVCLTWAPEDDQATGRIAVGDDAIDLWESWLADPSIQLIAHNAPFDVCVMAKAAAIRAGEYQAPGFGTHFERVFRLYESGRLRDTIPDQRLIDIAAGRAGDDTRMGTLAKRLLGIDMGDDKDMPSEWRHVLGTPVESWPQDARDATPWRFKYGLLRGVPLEQWPDEPKRYACDDPVITWGIVNWQDKRARKTFGTNGITNSREQTRAALDLHLHSVTGFLSDRERVQRLIGIYDTIEATCSDLLVTHCALCGATIEEAPAVCDACGVRVVLVREDVKFRGGRKFRGVWRPEERKRVKDRKAAQDLVWRTLGADAPLTKTARERGLPKTRETVSTDADTIVKVAAALADGRDGLLDEREIMTQAIAGGEALQRAIANTTLPVVNALRWYSRAQKYRTAFLLPLDTDRRVRTSYQVCKDTGRTSARKPNIQQYPRQAGLSAELTIRSCIIPDPGHVFLVCDYGQIELVGFAHVLNVLGRMNGRGEDYQSTLARAINDGMDGHIKVAAEVLHVPYDDALVAYKRAKQRGKANTQFERDVLHWRQVGKIENYGAAGGMGPATFVGHAAKQDAIISLEESYRVNDAWRRAWSPDVPDYFKANSDATNATGRADVAHLYSGRLRGRATFTQLCNTMFQGLCADGAKEAMRRIVDACFRDWTSPLFGCRPSLFVHDEFVLLCPREQAEAAAPELSRLMIAGMAQYIPDVRITADCGIMDRWGK